MSRKPKFNPEITRVRLNPEQAVLLCDCYDQGQTGTGAPGTGPYCKSGVGNREYKSNASGNSGSAS